MHRTLAFGLLAVSATQALTCTPSSFPLDASATYACQTQVTTGVNLHWRLDDVAQEVSFALISTLDKPGWVGLSFAEVAGKMGPAKGVIGHCDTPGTSCSALTYDIKFPTKEVKHPVTLDPSQKLLNSSFTWEAGAATLKFARKLTGTGGLNIDVTKPTLLNFATDTKYPITTHDHSATFQVSLDAVPAFPVCTPSILAIDADATYTCQQRVTAGVDLHWHLDTAAQEVSFALISTLDKPGWVGLSFAEVAGKMGPAKGVIGHCDTPGTSCSALTYDIKFPTKEVKHPVTLDPSQKLLNSSFTWEAGAATLKFARKLTGTGGLNIDITKPTLLNFATDTKYPITTHDHSATFQVSLDAVPKGCAPSQLSIDGHVDYECVKRVEAGVDMHWRLSEDQKTVALALTSDDEAGWLGFTIPSVAGQMAPAKGVIGECNTTCTVHTYSVTSGHGVPVHLDPSQHLINSSFAYENGVATLKFARVVDASAGNPIDVTGSTPFNFARTKEQLPHFHSDGWGSWTVEFAPKPTPPTPAPPAPKPSVCTPSTLPIDGDYLYACEFKVKAGVYMHWRVASDEKTVALALTSEEEPGWLGFTIPDVAGQMAPAKGVIAQCLDHEDDAASNCSVAGYTVTSPGGSGVPVHLDDSMVLINSSFSYESGVAVLRFARSVNSSAGQAIDVSTMTNFNFASTKISDLPHIHSTTGSWSVNLESGASQITSLKSKKVTHGILMVTAWLVLVPLAILLKRYGKTVFGLGINHFYGHIVLVLVALILTIAALVYAHSNKFGTGYHGHGTYMATMIIILMSANPVIGILGYIFVRDPNHPKRWIFSYSHKLVGYLLPLVTVIQCFYGVKSLTSTESVSGSPWYGVIITLLVVVVLAIGACEYKLQARKRNEYEEINK